MRKWWDRASVNCLSNVCENIQLFWERLLCLSMLPFHCREINYPIMLQSAENSTKLIDWLFNPIQIRSMHNKNNRMKYNCQHLDFSPSRLTAPGKCNLHNCNNKRLEKIHRRHIKNSKLQHQQIYNKYMERSVFFIPLLV